MNNYLHVLYNYIILCVIVCRPYWYLLFLTFFLLAT